LNFANYLSSVLIALALCISSAALMVWHIRAWRRLQNADIEPREREFRRRQCRRRMQTSAMLGLLGVAIFVGQVLMTLDTPLFLVIYWSGVLLLLLWMAILAVADMVATSFYYSREKNDYLVEHARLQGELLLAREKEAKARNGKPGSKH
jgi:UDP-N-acetylmuramyl pentapeptide phosphotransferase/UDP-N-acetylglucosamine-1-phosphate transferase